MSNVFENFQEKKKYIKNLTLKASEYGWIAKERADDIIKKIDSDVLTIGVIGQMKCGKSTFLNAFVFEEDILPAATTPMTASLSVITYGEEKKLVAEFYSKEEWAEQKLTANRNLDEVEGNELEKSKIKAAKELVEKSVKLGNNLESYLGKTQEDNFSNLVEYVGADGKYISITKSVKIFYPKEYLKGVEIVDTPGMNDPIVSREERTKEFLSKADVVLMMLYAGRPFDATDHSILFENVRKCGTGKVLIGINKYDIPWMNGESEEEIKKYVENEIWKACSDYRDDTISEILKEVDPVLISANMALLSKLPMTKISSNDVYNFDWKRYCEQFEISNQKQFWDASHIEKLSGQVVDLIENEKGQILFAKPKNEILAAGSVKKAELEKNLLDCQNELKILQMPDEELEEKLDGLSKANRKMKKKLDRLSSNLEELLNDEYLPKIKRYLEDEVEKLCSSLNKIIDKWKFLQSYNKIKPEIENEINKLNTRSIRMIEDSVKKIKRDVRSHVQDYFSDVDDLAGKHISEFDISEYYSDLKETIYFTLDSMADINISPQVFSNYYKSAWESFLGDGVFRLIDRGEDKKILKDEINKISSDFKVDVIKESILDTKNAIVEKIEDETIEQVLNPIQDAIENCKNDKESKEQKIEKLESDCKNLIVQKEKLAEQMKEITSF